MLHIFALLARTGARSATLQLGVVGPASHTTRHMGIGLTRLGLSIPSSTSSCRIECKSLADQNQVLCVSFVCDTRGFQREVTVVMDPFE